MPVVTAVSPFVAPIPPPRPRHRHEENLNALTHALGLAAASAGAMALIWTAARDGDRAQLFGCAIYSVTLFAVYAASTLSHVFRRPRPRRALRVADQAAIFLFIAGSYTAVASTWLRGGNWWLLHAAVWGVALIGFTSKVVFSHRVDHGSVSTILYLILGWLPILAARPILATLPTNLLLWLAAGGFCYTIGVVFLLLDRRFFHAAWHALVIAGSACHYLAILWCCTSATIR
jgi:hemolysin III